MPLLFVCALSFTVLEALSQGWCCRCSKQTTRLPLVLRNEWSCTSAPRICLQALDRYSFTVAQDTNLQLWMVRLRYGETAVCDEAVTCARFLGKNMYWAAQTTSKVFLGGRVVVFCASAEPSPALCKDTALPSLFRLPVTSVITYASNTKSRLRCSTFLHLKKTDSCWKSENAVYVVRNYCAGVWQ